MPDAEAAVLAKVQFKAGTVTGVKGYKPWRTHRQEAGKVTIVFSLKAFKAKRYARESPQP